MKLVKAAIQVLGPQKMPTVPAQNEEIRSWYRKVCQTHEVARNEIYFQTQNSFVIVPTTHPFLSPHMKAKDLRRHGTIIPIGMSVSVVLIQFTHTSLDERRQIKLITTGLPAIQEIVARSIAEKSLINNTTVVSPPTAKAVQ